MNSRAISFSSTIHFIIVKRKTILFGYIDFFKTYELNFGGQI